MARSLKNKDLKDWHNHPKMGRQVDEATPFITFKVPIGRQNGTTYSWGIPNLLKTCREDLGSELGMVIDLCNTDKWYDPRELQRAGVRHVKIPIQGKKVHAFKLINYFDSILQIPYEDQVQQFFAEVDDFCAENEDDKLLGVHSTFGGNRSGIFFQKQVGRGTWLGKGANNQNGNLRWYLP